MAVVKLGDIGKYRDAAGGLHDDAKCVHVWPDGETVNVAYTEGGISYADCNVPVLNRVEVEAPGRFFVKGDEYHE